MTLENVFNKVVFLLGAGASKDVGCQLSSDMLRSLRKTINNLNASDKDFIKYKDDFNEIYQFIFASLNYQSTMKDTLSSEKFYLNIEDFVMILRQLIDKEFIIPYPLIGNWNDKIIKWELRNGDVFSRFKDFILLQLVREWTKFDKDKPAKVFEPIRQLLTVSDAIKLNIFSLNYDLVFEETFNLPTLRILDNGFSERTVSGETTRYWAADFNNELSPTKINLYKLHGSLDWEYNPDSEDIQIKDNINDGREPLIIFGSYSKMLSFDPFLYILSEFRTLLSQATIFIVVGYSFHDKYINNLLIQQLSNNTDEDIPKKLIIVDPSNKQKTASEVADELRHIQDSKSINDVINFRRISYERIKLISTTAAEFYKDYFSNNADLLIRELEQTEQAAKIF
jgi:hypothetical protein